MSERDKYLTEAIGECLHSNIKAKHNNCPDCGIDIRECNLTKFSTWQGFGKLWEWAIKQEWWDNFLDWSWQQLNSGDFQPDWVDFQIGIRPDLINPNNLANAICKYLKTKEN